MSEQLRVERDGDVVIAAVSGEVDLVAVPALERAITAELPGAGGLVIDMTDVTFCDSSGVRMLDHIAAQCGEHLVGLRLVAPPDAPVRMVLRLTEFPPKLIAERLDEAIAAVR